MHPCRLPCRSYHLRLQVPPAERHIPSSEAAEHTAVVHTAVRVGYMYIAASKAPERTEVEAEVGVEAEAEVGVGVGVGVGVEAEVGVGVEAEVGVGVEAEVGAEAEAEAGKREIRSEPSLSEFRKMCRKPRHQQVRFRTSNIRPF